MNRAAVLLITFVSSLSFLIGCQGDANINLDQEKSYILVDNNRSMLTIYAMLRNDGDRSSDELYADFTIKDQLAERLGSDKILYKTDNQGVPERFSIEEGRGFFISESFSIEEDLQDVDVEESIVINVYDEEEEKILEDTMENIKKE
ncbi:hypothetical protein ACE1TI_18335 [Alteribacillus sp. JSM 102045]|uniref:hypothetical protein n=1 Tax=Alteribacillus sp. JSM 102045 TaxID=1562101 RepID=UPI0035C0210D